MLYHPLLGKLEGINFTGIILQFIKTKDRFDSIIAILGELNFDTRRVRLESNSAGEGHNLKFIG